MSGICARMRRDTDGKHLKKPMIRFGAYRCRCRTLRSNPRSSRPAGRQGRCECLRGQFGVWTSESAGYTNTFGHNDKGGAVHCLAIWAITYVTLLHVGDTGDCILMMMTIATPTPALRTCHSKIGICSPPLSGSSVHTDSGVWHRTAWATPNVGLVELISELAISSDSTHGRHHSLAHSAIQSLVLTARQQATEIWFEMARRCAKAQEPLQKP